jgi:site-specific recombinase XerC
MKPRNSSRTWKKVLAHREFVLYAHRTDATLWEARQVGFDRRLRRRFRASNLEEAVAEAPVILGHVPVDDSESITIEDAFMQTLAASNRSSSRADWLREAARFAEWLASRYTNASTWTDVSREMVRAYVDTMKAKAPNTIRLASQPIRQTSRYMSREYGLRDVAAGLGTGTKLVRETSRVYLEDVVKFVDWCAEVSPEIEAGAALQGLAGLQLKEALRLPWDCVDLGEALIEISGTVKNEYRQRVIPVCDRVVAALRRARDASPWATMVVARNDGDEFAEHRSYARKVRRALRAWNPEITWPPKDLRNCLLTFAEECGLRGDDWERYVGHAPRDVSGRHYINLRLRSRTDGERRHRERLLEPYRERVVAAINAGVAGHRPRLVLQHSFNFESRPPASEQSGRVVEDWSNTA